MPRAKLLSSLNYQTMKKTLEKFVVDVDNVRTSKDGKTLILEGITKDMQIITAFCSVPKDKDILVPARGEMVIIRPWEMKDKSIGLSFNV